MATTDAAITLETTADGARWTLAPWPDVDPIETVVGVDIVAFAGDNVVIPRLADGRWMRPGGTREPGEHWVLTAQRELLEETGYRLLDLHPLGVLTITFASDRAPLHRIALWCNAERAGEPTNPPDAEQVAVVAELAVDDALELDLIPSTAVAHALIRMAVERRAQLDDDTWFRDTTRLLETAYLSNDDVYAQSGKSDGARTWEASRRIVSRAVDRDGTFVDMCCANGLLMESVAGWCADDGFAVEPYGVDISTKLIDRARERLPQWGDRFFVANALTWTPPRRFDFVYALHDIVPRHRFGDLLDHLVYEVAAPGGRVIIGHYAPDDTTSIGDLIRASGHRVAGERVEPRDGRTPVSIAWIDCGAANTG